MKLHSSMTLTIQISTSV